MTDYELSQRVAGRAWADRVYKERLASGNLPELPPWTEQEILNVLHAVERGEVTLHPGDVALARESYSGLLSFRLSNGWTLQVFDDCREWDYIEAAAAPDREPLNYDALADMPDVATYKPANPTLWGLDY